MALQGSFSVYGAIKAPLVNNPLADLLPPDYEHGWHVARCLLKPLNHLQFLRRKEGLAEKLDLHNCRTSNELFAENFETLSRHMRGQIATDAVIERLVEQLCKRGRVGSEREFRELLRDYASITHMEFHPCDRCNLKCKGCTYGQDNPGRRPSPLSFPFEEIPKIARLRPASMVICGGGEPCLYRSGRHGFSDLIEAICETMPGIALGLVTNGTVKPRGEWPNRFRWIRVSLDAATPETYLRCRGRPLFNVVLENYLDYLDYAVPYVGIGFLFSRSNVQEYAQVARVVFELVSRRKPWALKKVNIQYRPLRRDPYELDEPFTEAVTPEQIEQAVRDVRKLAESSPEMKAFLRDQTNICAVLGGNAHVPLPFSRCYYSQVFRIVRASGELRPCFVRIFEPEFRLGNILTDELETIALNVLRVSAKRDRFCSPEWCRQCHVNHVFEQGLAGVLGPSESPEVRADPMF